MSKFKLNTIVGALAMSLSTFTPSVNAEDVPDVIIFGDSISSSAISWPSILSKFDKDTTTPHIDLYANVKNMAQGLLSFTTILGEKHFEFPRWVKFEGGPQWPRTIGVLFLGSNDAIFGTPATQYQDHVWEEMEYLGSLNIPEFYVVLPMERPEGHELEAETTWRRSVIIQAAEYHNLTILDIPYNWNMTTDGLHPTEYQSWLMALWFMQQLGLE